MRIFELLDELESLHSLGLEEIEDEYPDEFVILWQGKTDGIDGPVLEEIESELEDLLGSSVQFRVTKEAKDLDHAFQRLG
jgi:hypothetical protein